MVAAYAFLLQDGGHLLLRLTQLPACQPADLVPPPSSSSIASSSNPAAAAAKDSSKAAAAEAAASGRAADGAEGAAAGLTDQVSALLQKTVHDAESQVSAVDGLDLQAGGGVWVVALCTGSKSVYML